MSKNFELTVSSKDFDLSKSFDGFCKNLKKKLEDHAYGLSEELQITYKVDGKELQVSNSDDYKEMLENLKKQKELKFTITKTDDRGKENNFKTYVTSVVENALKDCMKTIVERLNKKELGEEQFIADNSYKKKNKEKCKDCNEPVEGFLYKETFGENENNDIFYCQKCAMKIDKPLFKIY